MGRGRLAAVAAVAVLALLASPAAALAQPTAPLGHQGRWITDADGRVVILHGFNMVNKRPPYHPSAQGFDDDDAAFLAREGFTTVRLGVIFGAVMPRPGAIDHEYLDEIAETVRSLRRHGLWTLLDFHQDLYSERFQGEGFPAWAVADDGQWNPELGFPLNYLGNPALQRAYDHFWANDPAPGDTRGLQDRYAEAWRAVAERFRGEPLLLGYDLFNEPWPGSRWASCASPSGCPAGGFDTDLTAFSRRVIQAIREVDGHTLVWYEPHALFGQGADSGHGDTGDDRAGFSFHQYCLGTLPGLPALPGSSDLCPLGEELVYDHAEQQSRETDDALLLSEFGATDDPVQLRRIAEQADARLLSWQNWTYTNVLPARASAETTPTEGVLRDASAPPTDANVKQDKLDVLARPYARAVAGTPQRMRFAPAARRFELTFSTRRPDGSPAPAGQRTEVVLPRRHYPGYRTEVSGGRVVSEPGARVLELVAEPGAREVRLTVVPGTPAARDPRARARLSARTSPRRDRRRPWTFTARGRVRRPAGVDPAAACRGRVTVTFKRGRRTVARRTARVRRNCAFTARVRMRSVRRVRPPARLRVLLRFGGNDALLPRRARARSVRAG